MNYELCKKLKEAGFEKITGKPIFIDEDFFPPSLSELIDTFQCRYKNIDGLINDAIFVLTKTFINGGEEGYMARLDGDWKSIEIENKYRFVSSSPEEAVAKLWLKLNEK